MSNKVTQCHDPAGGDVAPNSVLAGLYQLVHFQPHLPGLSADVIKGAKQGINGLRLAQGVLLGRGESGLQITAPLDDFFRIGKLLVGFQLAVDSGKYAQGMCLVLGQVACCDPAAHFDAQSRQGFRSMADGLDHSGWRRVSRQVGIELLPAGDQVIKLCLAGFVPAPSHVVFSAIGCHEQTLLRSADQKQLIHLY